MIKGLMGVSGITVSGGDTSLRYVNSNSQNPMQGMIRVNGANLEVFEGTGWMSMSTSYATVSLDQEILDVIQWARTQRTMALNRMTLAQNNPALLKALEAVKRAEDNFELLAKFVEHDQVQS
jgi:ABC-type histidine transport system ATPase subunit